MASSRPPLVRLLWRDKWLLGAAFVVMWRARIELSVWGFGDPRRGCVRTASMPPPPPALAARVAWSVDCAAHLVARPTCLVRAMTGQRLLALKGYGSEIRVGVRSGTDAGFEAHAWLRAGDAVILGASAGEPEQFRPIIGAAE